MVKIVIHGCNGRMGQFISKIAAADSEVEIVAGVDISDHISNPYPVYSSIEKCEEQADVVIDFASAKAVDGLLAFCKEKKVPCVLCTTGLNEAQLQMVQETSREVALLKSANMSLGINLLLKLLREAAPVLAAAGFDMEISEQQLDTSWPDVVQKHYIVTITNKEKSEVNIAVEKEWIDQDNANNWRPESITAELWRNDNNEKPFKTGTLNVENDKDYYIFVNVYSLLF